MQINIPTPKIDDERNGVKRPAEQSLAGYVWAVADAITEARKAQELEHSCASLKETREAVVAQLPDTKVNMIALYFRKWATFNGVVEAVKARKTAEKGVSGSKRNMTPEKAVETFWKLNDRIERAKKTLENANGSFNRHLAVMSSMGVPMPTERPASAQVPPAAEPAPAEAASAADTPKAPAKPKAKK